MSIRRNDNIGPMLKQYRKSCGYSVREVCALLNSRYDAEIAEKTIYGWESNQAHPTADMLLILCSIYGITNITAMIEKPYRETVVLTPDEEALLLAYRRAIPYQAAILALLNPFKPKPWPRFLQDDDQNAVDIRPPHSR